MYYIFKECLYTYFYIYGTQAANFEVQLRP